MQTSKLLIFKLTLFILMSGVVIGILEVSARLLYNSLTTPSGRWAVQLALSETFAGYDGVSQDAEKPRLMPHPYMLYQPTPNVRNYFGLQQNSLGYRQEEFDPVKKPGVKRILTLGGSTTYSAAVAVAKDSWSAQLEGLLQLKFPNGNFQVINGGVDSASSPEILAGWIFRHRFLKPDLVILNLGINDIWPVLLTKQYSPEYIYFRKSQTLGRPGRFLRSILKLSEFAKALYAFGDKDDADINPFVQVLDPSIYEGEEKNGEATRRVTETENTGFARNFDELIRVIKLDGAKVLVVMEPAMNEQEIAQKIPSRSAPFGFIRGLEHAWLLAQEKNYLTMEGLAKSNAVPSYRIPREPFQLSWFQDWYHLLPEGEHKKAELVLKGLIDNHLLASQ